MTAAYFAWKNGELIARESLVLPVASHAVQNGFVVAEDIPCFEGEEAGKRLAFRVKDHVTSFLRSAQACLMDVPYGADKLRSAVVSVVESCEEAPAFVRLMAYCESERMSAAEGVVVACVPFAMQEHEGQEMQETTEGEAAGIGAAVSSWRRPAVDALPAQIGLSAVRAQSEFALQEAYARGCSDAILLNADGCVCESARGCIFAVRDGVLASPPVSEGLFDSVMRDAVFSLAIDLEIPIVEERITRTDLYRAHEIFVAADTAGIVPVRAVDGRVAGSPGPITNAINERLGLAFRGALPEYADWLTVIE